MAKHAVLDIGTNSIHLVLAEVEPDFSYKILDRFKDMTRLGDGVFATRRLSDATMARGVEVIGHLTTLARNKGYDRIEAVATSAVREARNGGEFLQQVYDLAGLPVRVVTGQEEARLIYLGVRHSLDLPEAPTLIVDVGGGSVEIILCIRKELVQVQSLKLGAIRMKDLCLKEDPPSKAEVESLRGRIKEELTAALKRLKVRKIRQVIATSGMAGNLAEVVHLKRTGRPLVQLNLATVGRREMGALEKLLSRSTTRTRARIPGLDAKRVDTLLPATMVLRSLIGLLGLEAMTVSDKAIREGLIYDFIAKNRDRLRVEHEIPNVRRRQVVALARRCHSPERHPLHVAKLALALFDQTRALHGLGEREREWLEYAALLHDIGYLINVRRHHKHTYYLIKQSDLHALAAEEIEIIANVARYHRRAVPREGHEGFRDLGRPQRRTVEVLSALLRIADGLDRTHFGLVQGVTVNVGQPVRIEVQRVGDCELELWAAQGRSDLFERVFKRRVELKAHPAVGAKA